MSSFRPNVCFSAGSRVAASLAAAAVATSALIAGAPGAHAATVSAGAAKASAKPPTGTTGFTAAQATAFKAEITAIKNEVTAITATTAKATAPRAAVAKARATKARAAAVTATRAKARAVTPTKTRAVTPTKARAAAAQQDYTFYDSINPSQIPAGRQVATYADGQYAVSRSQVSDPGNVIWIDVSGNDANANALDVEPGDATPAQAAGWVDHRLTAHPGAVAIIYTMRSDWAAAQAAVDTLPAQMRASVRWWIADPTGQPHIVPGAQATQWYWGSSYDISTAEPGF